MDIQQGHIAKQGHPKDQPACGDGSYEPDDLRIEPLDHVDHHFPSIEERKGQSVEDSQVEADQDRELQGPLGTHPDKGTALMNHAVSIIVQYTAHSQTMSRISLGGLRVISSR